MERWHVKGSRETCSEQGKTCKYFPEEAFTEHLRNLSLYARQIVKQKGAQSKIKADENRDGSVMGSKRRLTFDMGEGKVVLRGETHTVWPLLGQKVVNPHGKSRAGPIQKWGVEEIAGSSKEKRQGSDKSRGGGNARIWRFARPLWGKSAGC